MKKPKLPKKQVNLPGTAKKPQSANYGMKKVPGGKSGRKSAGVC